MTAEPQKDNDSMDSSSNDDDDDNDWQQVPAKRKNSGSPKIFQQKRPHIDNEPSTSNRFSSLREEEEASKTETQPKPPPIFIPDVGDISKMVTNLSKVIPSTDFSYKSLRDGQVRLVIKTVDSYRKVVKYLETSKKSFHTFQLKPERAFRAVIKGLHYSTDISDIKAYLLSFGHQVRSVRNIVSRVTKNPLPMFFVDLDPDPKNKDIFNIRTFDNAMVEVVAPKKFDDIVQCFRCQEFGHTKSYCRKPFRCVKCGLGHSTAQCTKAPNIPPQCVHCLQNHTSSYKGCKIYQNLLNKRTERVVRPSLERVNYRNTDFTQQNPINGTMSYSQAVRGTGATEGSLLQKIDAMLQKQIELTNTLVNMMSMLMSKLCN